MPVAGSLRFHPRVCFAFWCRDVSLGVPNRRRLARPAPVLSHGPRKTIHVERNFLFDRLKGFISRGTIRPLRRVSFSLISCHFDFVFCRQTTSVWRFLMVTSRTSHPSPVVRSGLGSGGTPIHSLRSFPQLAPLREVHGPMVSQRSRKSWFYENPSLVRNSGEHLNNHVQFFVFLF